MPDLCFEKLLSVLGIAVMKGQSQAVCGSVLPQTARLTSGAIGHVLWGLCLSRDEEAKAVACSLLVSNLSLCCGASAGSSHHAA